MSSTEPQAPAEEAAATAVAEGPAVQRGAFLGWRSIASVNRRLTLWALLVLGCGIAVHTTGLAKPVWGTPQSRFESFVQAVARRLPTLLYGEDPFGLEQPPYEVAHRFITPTKPGERMQAELTFHQTDLSAVGQTLITRYKVQYDWNGDHWRLFNLNCEVERPPLTNLERLNFSAVLNHNAIEEAQQMVNSKRQQAEARLQPRMPLGNLLRSGDQY